MIDVQKLAREADLSSMNADVGALTERPYVVIDKLGVRYIGLHTSEDDCWRVALGWPSDDEIEWHKSQGVRVYPATITWTEK